MPPDPPPDEGRRRHYGQFYGLGDGTDARDGGDHDDRPLVVVWGNCQAEALRVLLAGDTAAAGRRPYRTMRVPAVHELTTADLPHVRRALAGAEVVFSQPIREDYRGLPIGTSQLSRLLPDRARVIRWPVLRYAGLYPFQAIVRTPDLGDPPVVPYHDLRTLMVAAGRPEPTAASARAYRDVAAASIAELTRRERLHDTVVASDLLPAAGVDAAHTVNHPGNTVLIGLAGRLTERAGWPAQIDDPGRTLLDSVHAPLREDVLAALGVDAPPRSAWTVAGRSVADEWVRAEQSAWYERHPRAVVAGMERHRATIATLWGAGHGAE